MAKITRINEACIITYDTSEYKALAESMRYTGEEFLHIFSDAEK